jgi:tripartite-type tricarboxylate transporter receptor subunit TctC
VKAPRRPATVRAVLAVPAALAAFALCAAAFAQTFPAKPIRIVLPVVAGSAPDLRVRQVAPLLSAALGQPVVVDNRPGANGAIGAREAAKAAADGYTLFNANISNALNDVLSPDPCCRLTEAFVAITDLARSPLVMVVHPSVRAATLAEFVVLARARPKGLSYASGGSGSIIQLLAERIKAAAGIDVVEVPYKSLGADLPNLLAGHVDAGFSVLATLGPHIRSGKLRALAVASERRLAVLPEIPTMAEAGLPGMEATVWNGMFAPAGTLRAAIGLLQENFARALGNAEIREQIVASGAEPGGSRPEEFAAFVRAEIAKWGRVVKDAGIRLE